MARKTRRPEPDDFQMFTETFAPRDVPLDWWDASTVRDLLGDRGTEEALRIYAGPLIEGLITRLGWENRPALQFSVIGWQIALLPEEQREEYIKAQVRALEGGPEQRVVFRRLLDHAVRRHLELFPRLHERVAEFRVRLAREAAAVPPEAPTDAPAEEPAEATAAE